MHESNEFSSINEMQSSLPINTLLYPLVKTTPDLPPTSNYSTSFGLYIYWVKTEISTGSGTYNPLNLLISPIRVKYSW
jgi:hypothetical protein